MRVFHIAVDRRSAVGSCMCGVGWRFHAAPVRRRSRAYSPQHALRLPGLARLVSACSASSTAVSAGSAGLLAAGARTITVGEVVSAAPRVDIQVGQAGLERLRLRLVAVPRR